MRHLWVRAVLSAIGAMSLGAVPAGASVVYYTDSTAWNGAVTVTVPIITFDSMNGTQTGIGIPLSSEGIDFVGIGSALTVDQLYSFGSNSHLRTDAVTSSTRIRANLPGSGVTAFGANVMSWANVLHPCQCGIIQDAVSLGYTLDLYNGATLLGSTSGSTLASNSSRAFVGFTSTTPVTHLFFVPIFVSEARLVLDNVSYGSITVTEPPVETPEASVQLLTALGLMLAGWKGWRRTKLLAAS